jgi:hypothetical protein
VIQRSPGGERPGKERGQKETREWKLRRTELWKESPGRGTRTTLSLPRAPWLLRPCLTAAASELGVVEVGGWWGLVVVAVVVVEAEEGGGGWPTGGVAPRVAQRVAGAKHQPCFPRLTFRQ